MGEELVRMNQLDDEENSLDSTDLELPEEEINSETNTIRSIFRKRELPEPVLRFLLLISICVCVSIMIVVLSFSFSWLFSLERAPPYSRYPYTQDIWKTFRVTVRLDRNLFADREDQMESLMRQLNSITGLNFSTVSSERSTYAQHSILTTESCADDPRKYQLEMNARERYSGDTSLGWDRITIFNASRDLGSAKNLPFYPSKDYLYKSEQYLRTEYVDCIRRYVRQTNMIQGTGLDFDRCWDPVTLFPGLRPNYVSDLNNELEQMENRGYWFEVQNKGYLPIADSSGYYQVRCVSLFQMRYPTLEAANSGMSLPTQVTWHFEVWNQYIGIDSSVPNAIARFVVETFSQVQSWSSFSCNISYSSSDIEN